MECGECVVCRKKDKLFYTNEILGVHIDGGMSEKIVCLTTI
ncbi:hypothetical protein [Neobacillus cucumis]|nr:hypothetical protein [Neobacillus cucumis]MDR4945155.1 hypothetical protein [Neobacillus cucumis]